jgi:SAM-dependent methyltransferase
MKKNICNICGSSDALPHLKDATGIIFLCRSCGLIFRDSHKKSEVPDPTVEIWGNKRYVTQRQEKEILQLNNYKNILPMLSQLSPGKQSVLEVGCGSGRFLNLLCSDGWDRVIGIEPSETYNQLAKQEAPAAEIVSSYLKDAQFADGSLDAVIMLHVIEHLEDPSSEVEEVNRVLKRYGVFVVETPRFDTIWFKLLKERERSVIPGHLMYFTTNSIKRLLNKKGFEIYRIDYVGRTLTYDRLLLNMARVLGTTTTRRWLASISSKYNLSKYNLYINLRDMMRVYARKL